MAEGFKIGDGYVEITSKVDDNGLRKNAEKAGDDTGKSFTSSLAKRAEGDKGTLSRVFSSVGDSIKSGLSSVVTGVLPVLGAAANAVLAFGPMVVHAGAAVVTFGGELLAAAPAALAFGSSLLIVLNVVKGFGPEIGKSLSPITDAFTKAEASAAKLATLGVRPLATEFVKLNMPAIRGMLDDIATATNGVITSTLGWLNTKTGIQAVSNITAAASDVATRLAPGIADLVQSFISMLGRISPLAAKLGSEGVAGALEKIKGILDGITQASVGGAVDKLTQTFYGVSNAVHNTVEVLKIAWDFYEKFKTEIGLVSDALGILAIVFGGPVTAIVAGVGIIIRHFDLFKALLLDAQSWFSGISGGSAILDRLKDGAMQVWAALQQAFAVISAAVAGPLAGLILTIQTQVLPALGNFYAALLPIAAAVISVLGPALAFILPILINMINFILQVIVVGIKFETWLLGIGPKVAAIWTSVVGFFAAAPGRVGAALAALPGVILAILVAVASKMLYEAGYMVGAYIKFLIDLPGRARSAIAGLWSAMTGAFTSAKNNASSAASSLVSGTIKYLSSLPGKARSAIAGVPGQIKSVFSGAGSWLYSAGANILHGLVNGMKGAVGAAVNAAVGAAKSVINGLKAGLGIHSPSKVAEEEVGAYVMPGVAKGITKSLPAFQSQVQGIAPVVATSAVGATVAAATSTGSTTTTIGTLAVTLKGILDPNDPASARRMIAELYDALNAYEKSYA